MQHVNRWVFFVLVLASLLLAACSKAGAAPVKVQPSAVEEIEGSELKRVTITEKAAERLVLQTVMVREEPAVLNQIVVGEVVDKKGEAAASPDKLWVRAPFKETDLQMVALDQPARVLPLDDDGEDSDQEENGWIAEPDETLALDDDEENGAANGAASKSMYDSAVYFVVNRPNTSLVPGQRVFVEVPQAKNGVVQKVIPYAALIYDVEGGTWVYVKEPDALSFIRQSVTVDFILGDQAYLVEGPEVGTQVVTMGAAELYGVETGVSK